MSSDSTADRFLAANSKSPVVYGRAIEPNPNRPAKGAVYRLKNGQEFRLSVADCKAVGMPRWDI